jgi:hypothetical protein
MKCVKYVYHLLIKSVKNFDAAIFCLNALAATTITCLESNFFVPHKKFWRSVFARKGPYGLKPSGSPKQRMHGQTHVEKS